MEQNEFSYKDRLNEETKYLQLEQQQHSMGMSKSLVTDA